MNITLRRSAASVSVLLFMQILPAFSQDGFICGTSGTHSTKQFRGEYLPEQGAIRVLVVDVLFSDDTTSSDSWPSGQLPGGYARIIAPANSASHPTWTLSDYYRKMSKGTEITELNLIGDVYYALVWVPNSSKATLTQPRITEM